MKRRFILIALVALAAAAVFAASGSDTKLTVDGSVSLAGYNSVALLGDGDATIYLITAAGDTARTHYIVANTPRNLTWTTYGNSIVGATVDLVTASYVIATPGNQ